MCHTRLALAVLGSLFHSGDQCGSGADLAIARFARRHGDPDRDDPWPDYRGSDGAPIPRANVQVSGGKPSANVNALAADDGVFVVSGLTPGHYVIRAAKVTFEPGQLPVIRPGRRSALFDLKPKQVLDVGAISLQRASVVAGRVVDRFGDPAPFIRVMLRPFPGARRRVRHRSGSVTATNDIGEFRFASVEPADYLLVATAAGEPFEERPFPETQNGLVIYPAAIAADQAAPLSVQAGESISDIELRLFEATPARVTGEIRGPDGALVASASLDVGEVLPGDEQSMSTRGSMVSHGVFDLRLPPGVFDLTAASETTSNGTNPFQDPFRAQGRSRVTVTGDLVEGVVIHLALPRRLTGRIVLDGTGVARPPAPDTIGVAAEWRRGLCEPRDTVVKPDLTFLMSVNGERCRLVAGWREPGWSLRSVTQAGKDVTFEGVSLGTSGAASEIVMTFTDRRTRVVVDVTDDRGVRAEEFLVVMFPVDRAHRVTEGSPASPLVSRTMRQIGPGVDGSGSADGFAPGEYLVVALNPDEVDESADAAFYERLEGVAQRVTLIEGDTKVLSLKLAEMPAERR